MLDLEKLLTNLRNVDEAEIYYEKGSSIYVEMEKERIKKTSFSETQGVGIRVVRGKRIGFAYTSDPRKVKECAELSIKISKTVPPDEKFISLPSPGKYPSPKGTYDKNFLSLSDRDAVGFVKRVIDSAKSYDRRVTPTTTTFSAGRGEVFILNTSGVEVRDKGTFFSAHTSVVVDETSAEEGEVVRNLKELKPEWIGSEAARVAVSSLSPSGIGSGKMDAVFTPRALLSLLLYTTIPQLSADSVRRGKTPYKKGMEALPPDISLIDDGRMDGGVYTSRMDGEGTPKQRTVLVSSGILKGFLYDSYYAFIDRRESTGNAGRSYDTLPKIHATNLLLEGKKCKREELLQEKGILISDLIGAHTSSRASGGFSVLVHNPFMIKNGELSPVHKVMIAGNVPDLLRSIEMLGDDTRQIGNLVAPSIRIKDVSVIG